MIGLFSNCRLANVRWLHGQNQVFPALISDKRPILRARQSIISQPITTISTAFVRTPESDKTRRHHI
jgi:hypothetical protein